MIVRLEPAEFLMDSRNVPVIDVRSPSEYRQGHIPGAFNIPLFDDDERAVVGTIYARSGQETAIGKGMEMAVPKTGLFIRTLKEISPRGKIMLYCWRGGLRSKAMAELFYKEGYRCGVLEGGYKAYRRMIRHKLSGERPVIILGGRTGSGKTRILKELRQLGEQIIDLEALANHKGSVFGHFGQSPQPTNEQYENELFRIWDGFDALRPLWLEDESRMIGRITLPDPVIHRISNSPMILIQVGQSVRINNLVDEYALYDIPLLEAALRKISQRIGGERTTQAINALREGDFQTVASIALAYYDKAYAYAVERRTCRRIVQVSLTEEDPAESAILILNMSKEFLHEERHIS